MIGRESLLSTRQKDKAQDICSGIYWEAYNHLQLEVMQGRMKPEQVTEEAVLKLARKILQSGRTNVKTKDGQGLNKLNSL